MHMILVHSLVEAPQRPSTNGAVIHLVIRRTAKLAWQSTGDNHVELAISSSETADSIARRVEAQKGLPAGSTSLLYQGKVLSSSKPLASYGVEKGSVLELIPVEVPQSELPDSSPLLSSPEHELVQTSVNL